LRQKRDAGKSGENDNAGQSQEIESRDGLPFGSYGGREGEHIGGEYFEEIADAPAKDERQRCHGQEGGSRELETEAHSLVEINGKKWNLAGSGKGTGTGVQEIERKERSGDTRQAEQQRNAD
jgi:hypothetical protein